MSRLCSAAKNSPTCFYLIQFWSACVSVSPACKWELRAPSALEARPCPCASLWHRDCECRSSLVGGGTLLKFRLRDIGTGRVKLLLVFGFCHCGAGG